MADEGERCQVCGDFYTDVYWLPDEWWELVTPKPEHPDAGLLCPPCALRRLLSTDVLPTQKEPPTCVIEVGHPAGTPAAWVNAAHPEHTVCDRHRQYYDTAYDDYDIEWHPAVASFSAARIPKDPEARARLAQFAGLSDEEHAAIDEWCRLQAIENEARHRRGLEAHGDDVLGSDVLPTQRGH